MRLGKGWCGMRETFISGSSGLNLVILQMIHIQIQHTRLRQLVNNSPENLQ